jgi:hypothetical protein
MISDGWYGQANSLRINQIKSCHMAFIIEIKLKIEIIYLMLIRKFQFISS